MNDNLKKEMSDLIKKINSYKINNRYDEAMKCFERMIEIEPNDKETYKNRGILYSEQGNYEEAIKDYTRAIKLDIKYKEAYNNRGIAYSQTKEYEKAIKDYTKVIELDLRYKDAYNNRGNVYYLQQKYEKAVEDYTKVILIDPQYQLIYNKRGCAYSQLGNYDKAILDYDEGIRRNSKNKVLYANRANSYYVQGNYDKSIADCTKVLKLDPKYKDAYVTRGAAYGRQEKYDKAISDCTEAIKIDCNCKDAYNNRGNAYFKQEKYEEAINDYEEAIKIDCNFQSAYNNKGNVYFKQGKYEEAINDKVKARDRIFWKYVENNEDDAGKKINMYKLFLKVMELKDKCIYSINSEGDKLIGHYTKIGNLKYLLKSKDDKCSQNARLRINNVSYMNDPEEGEVFKQLLLESIEKNDEKKELSYILYKNEIENDRKIINGKSNVFLVSFSKAIDTSLPMWIQYSENGKGCCLVFDSKFFDREDDGSLGLQLSNTGVLHGSSENVRSGCDKYCLYEVLYIGKNDNGEYQAEENVTECIKEIGMMLFKLENDLKLNSSSKTKEIIQNILDQVRFLFKDKSYEYEKEVRIVKFEGNGNIKYTDDVEGFIVPHVYINLDKEIKLKEVILGPKVDNVSEIANYLYYTEKVDKVSKSNIKYR